MERIIFAAIIKAFYRRMGKIFGFDANNQVKKCTTTLYQRVIDIIFKELIKEHHQISNQSIKVASLHEREANALRYVAAYVCRHLRRMRRVECAPPCAIPVT